MDEEGFNKMMISRAKSLKDEDFKEEDMWAFNFMKEKEGSSLKPKRPAVPKVIPVPRVNSGNEHRSMTHQPSYPVNIPEWSKIYTKQKSSRGLEDDAWANGNGGKQIYMGEAVDDDDEDSDEMLPPHEFIARRLARSPVVSCSMCEGVGRTLKGRDLSKLRNDILTKTGFIE